MAKQKPIYILHGWAIDPTNEQKWAAVRDSLSQRGWETVFLPFPGLTGPEPTTVWNLDDYVDWVRAALPKKGQVTLWGHSFGGQVAARLAAQYPDQVENLILMNSSGIRNDQSVAQMKRLAFRKAAKLGTFLKTIPTVGKLAEWLLYKLAREKDYYQATPRMKQIMAKVVADEVRPELPSISAKTLVLWGEFDQVTPLWMGKIMAKAIPRARLAVVLGGRHGPQFSHPAQVAGFVADFLVWEDSNV